MRYQLAWNYDACRGVVAAFVRAVLGSLRARARDGGVDDARGGAVAVIQRFGGALNLNLHIHALVLDGVFARNRAGVLNFHPTRRLITALDVAEVLATVEPRIKAERKSLSPLSCPSTTIGESRRKGTKESAKGRKTEGVLKSISRNPNKNGPLSLKPHDPIDVASSDPFVSFRRFASVLRL